MWVDHRDGLRNRSLDLPTDKPHGVSRPRDTGRRTDLNTRHWGVTSVVNLVGRSEPRFSQYGGDRDDIGCGTTDGSLDSWSGG